MMHLFALRQQRFPAWLGIFAILTIAIAPIISQALVQLDRDTNAQYIGEQINTAGHHHPTTSSPADKTKSDRQSHDSHTTVMMDHAACGYCVLFSYSPALSAINSLVVVSTNSLYHELIPLPISSIIAIERFVSPLPRAPPL